MGGKIVISWVFGFFCLIITPPVNPRGFRCVVYSGFSHFCFWQCSDNRLTGSFPVHDAPPIKVFASGLLGPSPANADPSTVAAEELPEVPCFEKTLELSPPREDTCDEFLPPLPPPGLPPFFTIFDTLKVGYWQRHELKCESTGAPGVNEN